MTPGDFAESPLAKARRKEKELQHTIKTATETIKVAMQELEKLKQFTDMYRSFMTDEKAEAKATAQAAPTPVSIKLRGAAHGQTQAVFQSLALAILRDVGRPMKSGEFVEEFAKRGHPLGGNEVRTAWNRLWEARANGMLTHDPKLGYWIAGEPLSKAAEERALIAAKQMRRRKRDGPSLVTLGKGKPKGPPRALNADQVATAERLLLEGQTLKEVAGLYGVAIRTLALALPEGKGIAGLKAKYPDVVIPTRPHIYRPLRPGHRPLGRPRILTGEQDRQIAELRSQGKSINQIAGELGLKRSSINSSLQRAKKASPTT
jgi:hypothetical protein